MDELIGRSIRYFDYLGAERYGRILYIEPYPLDPEQVYVYIEDEEVEFNVYDIYIPDRRMYAEIRLSSEVELL